MREAHVHEISLIPALVAHNVVCSTTGDELLGPGRYSMPCSVLSAILWGPEHSQATCGNGTLLEMCTSKESPVATVFSFHTCSHYTSHVEEETELPLYALFS